MDQQGVLEWQRYTDIRGHILMLATRKSGLKLGLGDSTQKHVI